MPLAAYIGLWIVAALASLVGLPAVWVPCVVFAGALLIRHELLVLLGSLVRVKPMRQFDRSIPADSKAL